MPPQSKSPNTASKQKTTPPMKQGKLNFSVKRANSGTTLEKKGRSKPSNVPIVVEDSDDDGNIVLDEKLDKRSPSTELSISKKRKLDDDEAELKDGEKRKTIFKSRTSLENVSDEKTDQPEEPVKRPKLNVKEKRWQSAYNQAKGRSGGVKPIHSEGQNKIHEILHVFDLSYEYGPCIGVTRLERWTRADALGLKPPPEIRDILMTEEGSELPEYAQCVFYEDV
ncbi:hypothetical protein QCA50_011095 [Cerrena zonata]|uniref:DNA polymerase delta subunit 4 n=1 Tax=Cerrena zonata TaxID=2478898 RepID=A0AAW0G613_9APHY